MANVIFGVNRSGIGLVGEPLTTSQHKLIKRIRITYTGKKIQRLQDGSLPRVIGPDKEV
jgi:hypothetical protein